MRSPCLKWGCDVTAISSSHDEDEQARSFGARPFLATRGSDDLKNATGTFDFVMSKLHRRMLRHSSTAD
jgi:hypothetical protein